MKRFSIILLLLFSIVRINASPLHSHYKHTIIIDTDCAIDDMRAISLLLSLPNITIKAIMVSDGSLSPKEGAIKVKALLQQFHRDTIPVFTGKQLKNIHPEWRAFNQQLNWGNKTNPSENDVNLQQIAKIIQESKEQVTLFCLGPVTNISQLVKENPAILSNIEDVIWFNKSANPLKGFNYECDTKAAESIFESKLKINIISTLEKEAAVFDTTLYNTCKNANTIVGTAIYNTHNQPLALKKLQENHFKLWDELAAIFLINPELFTIETFKSNTNIRYNTSYVTSAINDVLQDIILGKYKAGEFVAFYGFPTNREMYTYDVRIMMDSTIARYGLEEWKACVMTDEFHGHLGVFSIVGAKMGMRARDFFSVSTDLLEVVSSAGTKPPYSCMNDGIQVSTGATLGQGTIHLKPDTKTKPEAIFSYKGDSIRITLKPEYLSQIEADIHKNITQFGLDDENYWSCIRQCALNYWLEWDRKEIFEVEIINK